MSERMLITKLVRDGERADLYGRGHQYKDLTLFDLSDLADVGIDYAALQSGEETPCRFWAVYDLSDKLNKAGNPYKDILALEPIDSPATTTSTDTSALLAELRAIRALLEIALDAGTLRPANWAERLEAEDLVGLPFADEEEDVVPDDGPASGIADRQDAAALEDEFGPRPIPLNGEPPTTPEALLNVLKAEGLPYTAVGHVLYAIKKNSTVTAWPEPTDANGWAEVARLAREYAHAYL